MMSQGKDDLKHKLEKAKRKGKVLRSLHQSDVNSLERDDSSDIDRAIDQPMISKEMRIPIEKYICSAVDTPFLAAQKGKVRVSSLNNKNFRPNSTKGSKKRASSFTISQNRKYLNNNKNSCNSHDISAQMDNYAVQKYYNALNAKNHKKSTHPNLGNHNYSNIG